MDFWIVAGIAAFLLGLSKGGVPMVAMLSVPLLSVFMDPAMAAGLLLPLYIVADGYAIWLFRHAFSKRNLAIMLPASVVGIVAGYLAVSAVPGDAVKLLLALIGLSYLAKSLHGRYRGGEIAAKPADVAPGLFWGALAGLTSYIAHSGGPPFQAYVLPQKLDKRVYLGTTTIFFAAVNLMKVPPYVLAGQMDGDTLLKCLWLAPMALAGAWGGARISLWLSDRVFFAIVEIALGALSLKLLWDVFG